MLTTCPKLAAGMRANLRSAAAASLLALTVLARPGSAYEVNEHLGITGLFQGWMTLYEQMEDAEGLYQLHSGDEAATSATGFGLARARVEVEIGAFERRLSLLGSVRFERSPAILDLYARIRVARWLDIRFGQMKIPASYEVLDSPRVHDFVLATQYARTAADWALSRTPLASSLFAGNRALDRDFGLGVGGEAGIGIGSLRWFVMVGNGLGANLYIGGSSQPGFVITNGPQFFYGARLEARDLFGVATLGGHVSYNRHDDMVFSGRTVYDLCRTAASGDLRIRLPRTGLTLTGMYGYGLVDDDYDADDHVDLRYQGWEARLVWDLGPMLAAAGVDPAVLDLHEVSLGFRYDAYSEQTNESGMDVRADDFTIGAAYSYRDWLKLQLNYVIRRTRHPAEKDLDDDLLVLQVQTAI